jgi:enoyl-CoA hydratase/carnithine racemase
MDVILNKQEPVACVIINREKAYNALNSAIMERLEHIFLELEHDEAVMVVVITVLKTKWLRAGSFG